MLAFGAGVAIEAAGDSLEIAIVRVRPGGPELLRRATIARFQERPASEWSSEFREAVRGHQPSGVTVLLPRRDVIVRHVLLPGVPKRELAGALALRLRSLHPFADDDVAWCWKPVPNGALAGLTRLSHLSRYESLFAEAGIPIAGFTFSATVLHSALRLYGEPSKPFLGLSETAAGIFEAYGESRASAIFSGEFAGPAARAASCGVAELRLSAGTDPAGLAQLLPRNPANTGANPIDRPLLYAAAIAAACPLLVRPANFLPAERRAGQSRIWLIPTAILAFILILCVAAALAIGPYRDRHYVQTLRGEVAKVQPLAQRAAALDRATDHARAQIQLLDTFRGRSQSDFEVLNELTRLLAPPAWASLVEIYPDSVIVSGVSPQAAPLLKVLDGSTLFHNSEFTNSVARSGKDELFRIKTYRRLK
jgi:hypothetical protein